VCESLRLEDGKPGIDVHGLRGERGPNCTQIEATLCAGAFLRAGLMSSSSEDTYPHIRRDRRAVLSPQKKNWPGHCAKPCAAGRLRELHR
jgi:hypothetical protein